MANKDTPMGFRPYGEVKQALDYVAGSAVYPGDCVAAAADGGVDPASTGANDILGVALSYASAAGESVLVSVHPDQLYVAQVNDADYAAQSEDFDTMDIVATAGNSTYKQSRMELNGSSQGASQQFVIHKLYPDVQNAVGAQAEVVCSINRHQIWGEDDSAGLQ